MAKYGIIYCAYQTEDLVDESLAPWIEARATRLGGHQFVIAAVSVPFAGFDAGPKDGTQAALRFALAEQQIDHLITEPENIPEMTARSMALCLLRDQGCQATIQWDSDEVTTLAEIGRILAFVERNPYSVAFRGSYRNHVFDRQIYLVEPFRPMRIHRMYAGDGFLADGFWDDNNVRYRKIDYSGPDKRDIDFPVTQIPKSIQFTPHFSWLNDLRSKRKLEYQSSRPGWRCDFAWDDTRGLVWRDGVGKETARDE